MTIVSALKKLFKKITGKETTGGTIDEIINELSSEYVPGEGGGLPEGFPQEDISNANKYIGFDENGDYEAKELPSTETDYTVVLTNTNPGEGAPQYAATLNGESVTLQELLTLAAANTPLRVVVPHGEGTYMSASVTYWDANSILFTAPIIIDTGGTSTVATAIAACTIEEETGETWVAATI